jgi:hypothetical protein
LRKPPLAGRANSANSWDRRSWVLIEELLPQQDSQEIDRSALLPRWGTRIQLRGPTQAAKHFGRLEVERQANRIVVHSFQVRRFRWLLSPAEFDFSRPIEVVLNGQTLLQRAIEPSVATLLRWAAKDDDRRRLFAAEIQLDTASTSGS